MMSYVRDRYKKSPDSGEKLNGEAAKEAISTNARAGADPELQYHLSPMLVTQLLEDVCFSYIILKQVQKQQELEIPRTATTS